MLIQRVLTQPSWTAALYLQRAEWKITFPPENAAVIWAKALGIPKRMQGQTPKLLQSVFVGTFYDNKQLLFYRWSFISEHSQEHSTVLLLVESCPKKLACWWQEKPGLESASPWACAENIPVCLLPTPPQLLRCWQGCQQGWRLVPVSAATDQTYFTYLGLKSSRFSGGWGMSRWGAHPAPGEPPFWAVPNLRLRPARAQYSSRQHHLQKTLCCLPPPAPKLLHV